MSGKAMSGLHHIDPERRKRFHATISSLNRAAMDAIKKAINGGDAATARWALEMDFGKPTQRQEVSGPEGGPIAHADMTGFSTTELLALRDVAKRAQELIAVGQDSKSARVGG